jgi:hypothetical protein
MKHILVLLIVVSFSREGYAWNEPTDFEGVPFGSSELALYQHLQVLWKKLENSHCVNTTSTRFGERLCVGHMTIGPISTIAAFFFRSDALSVVALKFNPPDFTAVESLFRERYGSPTKVKEDVIRIGAGSTIMNRTVFWLGSRNSIMLDKYSGDRWSYAFLAPNAEIIEAWIKILGEIVHEAPVSK